MNKKPLFVLIAVVLGAAVPGCIGLVLEGIHFKQPNADFGLPPPRFAVTDGDGFEKNEPWRPGTQYFLGNYDNFDSRYDRAQKLPGVAFKAERLGEYSAALAAWREEIHRFWGRNELPGRIMVLRYLAKHPLEKGGKELLAALPPVGKPAALPSPTQVSEGLRPYVDYFAALKAPEPGPRLLTVAGAYPNSPVAECALIEVPRLLLGITASPNQTSVELSAQAMHQLMLNHPHTRFRFDVGGWRGRIAFLAGDYAQALHFYRWQIASASADDNIVLPLDSVTMCQQALHNPVGVVLSELSKYKLGPTKKIGFDTSRRLEASLKSLGSATAMQLGHAIRSDPSALSNYLDYRVDLTASTEELPGVGYSWAAIHSPPTLRGHIFARLAEASLHLNNIRLANDFASKAIHFGHEDTDISVATYVRATVAARLNRSTEALRLYEIVARRYSKTYVAKGAEENLAILFEKQNDLGKALDIYRNLKYIDDRNYLIDMRMSVSDLERYIHQRPTDKQLDLLNLSLGYRYLRLHQWNSAIRTFRRLSRRARLNLVNDPKIRQYSDDPPQPDPIITAQSLKALDLKVDARHGDAKASAMLDVANFYYRHHNLLLYNGALWEFGRQYTIQFSWNDGTASDKDRQALEAHHWQHECFAQTLILCKQILRKYPHSALRAAAAYRGACAAERLSHFSRYWRWQNSRINLLGQAAQLMAVAAHSKDSWLSARAKKYYGVFVDEERDLHRDEYVDSALGKPHYRAESEW